MLSGSRRALVAAEQSAETFGLDDFTRTAARSCRKEDERCRHREPEGSPKRTDGNIGTRFLGIPVTTR
jgi:hypothetical protein